MIEGRSKSGIEQRIYNRERKNSHLQNEYQEIRYLQEKNKITLNPGKWKECKRKRYRMKMGVTIKKD